jgi:hypothetical protein
LGEAIDPTVPEQPAELLAPAGDLGSQALLEVEGDGHQFVRRRQFHRYLGGFLEADRCSQFAIGGRFELPWPVANGVGAVSRDDEVHERGDVALELIETRAALAQLVALLAGDLAQAFNDTLASMADALLRVQAMTELVASERQRDEGEPA